MSRNDKPEDMGYKVIKNGVSVVGYENGRIIWKQNYPDGDQKWRVRREIWYRNGQLGSKENVVHGEYHGLQETWHDNGQDREKENYIDGKRHGLKQCWCKDGRLLVRSNYINGDCVSDKEYQTYQENIRIVLNQIVQIKDLSNLISNFP